MEFGKKIKGIFGSSKEQPMTVPEEKKQAASIRQETEKVKNALLALRLVDTTGTIPQEYLEEYKKIIRGLTARLDNAQVSLQDTKRIDRTLLFFVQKLDTAVKNGCRDTAERIKNGLLYGIGKAHETIQECDYDKADAIMEEREKRLDQYRTIVEYSIKVDEREQTIALQSKKYEEMKEKFQKAREAVLLESKQNPHLVKLIDEYGEGVRTVDPDAYSLVVRRNGVQQLYKNLKQLKAQKVLNENAANTCRRIISSEESILTEMAHQVDQHLLEEVMQHEEDFRRRLVDLQKQMRELEELGDRFSDAVDQVFSSPAMVDFIIKASLEYDDMEKEIRRNEEGREEGRRLMQEEEQEQMYSQQEQHSQLINN